MKTAKKCSSDLAWLGMERQNLGSFLENRVTPGPSKLDGPGVTLKIKVIKIC
jgi:hypothetical protein